MSDGTWNVLRQQAIEKLPELLKDSPQKTALNLLRAESKVAMRKAIDAKRTIQEMRLREIQSPAKFIAERRTAAERAADEKQAILDRLEGAS